VSGAPGEERKWRIMMGNGHFLTDKDKARLERLNRDAEEEDAD
jgi:hypothetical protein